MTLTVSPMSERDLQRSQKQRQRFVGTRYFLYTPIWGEVIGAGLILMMGVCFIGYIYRKRILPFDKCPVDIKKEK
jgi:hypothetical protein